MSTGGRGISSVEALTFAIYNTDVDNFRLAHQSLIFSVFVSAVLRNDQFYLYYFCEMFPF